MQTLADGCNTAAGASSLPSSAMLQASPLAGRYRFLKRLSAGPPRTVWLAEDVGSGIMVIVVRIANRVAEQLAPVVRVQHPHLACLLDIIRSPDPGELPEEERDKRPSPFAIAEWVSGQTLYDALMQGPVDKYHAVQTVAYVASAVAAVHTHRAFHGSISARTVVLERVDEGPGPVLTQVVMPADGSYASPERLAGQGPSQDDDVWALHVLLYAALTGQRPFRAQTREELLRIVESPSPVPLDALGLRDAKLQTIIDRGFAAKTYDRTRSVQSMETELFSWLAAHSSELTIDTSAIAEADRILEAERRLAESTRQPVIAEAATVLTPAPLQAALASMTAHGSPLGDENLPGATDEPSIPASGQPLPVAEDRSEHKSAPIEQTPALPSGGRVLAATPKPTRQARSGGVLALLFSLAGLGVILAAAAGGYLYMSSHRPPPDPPVTTASATPALAPPASSLTAAPSAFLVPMKEEAPVDPTPCIAAHFTSDTFEQQQDLSFVCNEADPRAGSATMRAKLVRGSRGKLTSGMNMWPRLGWHELTAYGMMRRKCCAGHPGIELPAPTASCPSLATLVDELSRAYEKGSDIAPHRDAFIEAATCTQRIRDRNYRYSTGPLSGGQVAFNDFARHNAR